MHVGIVHPVNVPKVWSTVSPYLQKATVAIKERLDIVDLMEQCLKGKQVLWICVEEKEDKKEIVAAFTTTIIEYPKFSSLSVQYLGGRKIKSWLPEAMSVIKKFARDAGCETIEGYGRDAWLKYLTEYGFGKVYSAFEVDLTKEDALDIAAE